MLSSRSTDAGFTLIELLVVIFIIGIILTIGALAVGSDNRQRALGRESERMAELIRLAGEESITRMLEIGVRFKPDEYAFLVLDGETWQILEERPFGVRKIEDEFLQLDLVVEGTELELSQETKSPQVLLLSSGEMTPFQLNLKTEGLSEFFQVVGRFDGSVELQGPWVRNP